MVQSTSGNGDKVYEGSLWVADIWESFVYISGIEEQEAGKIRLGGVNRRGRNLEWRKQQLIRGEMIEKTEWARKIRQVEEMEMLRVMANY